MKMQMFVSAVFGLCLVGGYTHAEIRSVVGINKIIAPTGDSQWLLDWINTHQRRSGNAFNPMVAVVPFIDLAEQIGDDVSAVALVPTSMPVKNNLDNFSKRKSGVNVCIAAVAQKNLEIKSIGDLHALEEGPRIAVSRDLRYIAEPLIELYSLVDKVEIVETDNEGALSLVQSGVVQLGFASASDNGLPSIFTLYEEDVELVPVPIQYDYILGMKGLFLADIALGEEELFSKPITYRSLCDSVDVVTTSDSVYKRSAVLASAYAERPLEEDKSIFSRVYNALQRLFRM